MIPLTRILLFDLDGTLTDPRRGIVGCLRYALDQLGVPCPDDHKLATYIGPSLRGAFAELLATSDTERIKVATDWYRQRFADMGLYENEVYEGIPAMLELVKHSAKGAYVATAKPWVYAERIVRHFGFDQYFRGVYGPDLDGRWDDKADLLAHLLTTERIEPGEAVMIGDRAGDIIAAKANGVSSMGVLWGYGTESELTSAGADMLCRAPSELVRDLLAATSSAINSKPSKR